MSKLLDRLKGFLVQCRRVFQVTKKPTRQEYTAIVKVTGLGILLIGLIGFIVYLVATLTL